MFAAVFASARCLSEKTPFVAAGATFLAVVVAYFAVVLLLVLTTCGLLAGAGGRGVRLVAATFGAGFGSAGFEAMGLCVAVA